MGSTVRLAGGSAGRASARVLTVLLLLAAVGMLSLPSTAHAVVGKKHARAYRIVVSSMLKAKNIDVQSYNALDDAVVDTAQNIIEIYQGDPVDHDALLEPGMLGGCPFFTSVPSGRVGAGKDARFRSNDDFRAAVAEREAADVADLERRMDRRLERGERARIGVQQASAGPGREAGRGWGGGSFLLLAR